MSVAKPKKVDLVGLEGPPHKMLSCLQPIATGQRPEELFQIIQSELFSSDSKLLTAFVGKPLGKWTGLSVADKAYGENVQAFPARLLWNSHKTIELLASDRKGLET